MGALMIVGVVMMLFMTGGKMPAMGSDATAHPVHVSAPAPDTSGKTDEQAQTPVTGIVTPSASD